MVTRIMKNNIVLIGMPGVGKSTVGVVLAKKMGYRFIDSDLLIQEEENALLHQIIEEKGIDGFNKIEEKVNAAIQVENAIIATGGSVVYGQKAMEHLKQIGTVIYLELPLEELKERLGDLHQRGVSMRVGQTLDKLYQERRPLYEKYADMVINCDKKQIREIVEEISSTRACP